MHATQTVELAHKVVDAHAFEFAFVEIELR